MQSADPTVYQAITVLVKALGIWAVLGLVAVGGALYIAWRALERAVLTRVGREAGKAVAKELAEHQSALDADLESRRAIHRQQQQRFELYTTRQHAVYRGLYARLRKAEGLLVRGELIESAPDYAKWRRGGLQRRAARLKIPDDVLATVLEAFDAGDRTKAGEMFAWTVKRARAVNGQQAFTKANNYISLNELYLSSDALPAVHTVVGQMAEYVAWVEEPEEGKSLAMFECGEKIRDMILDLRDVLQREMRSEHAR